MDDPKRERDIGDDHIGGLENNVRNVRAILDQAKSSFGPETKRQVEALESKTDTTQIERQDFKEVLPPEAWMYLGLLQLTEIVNNLVVQQTTPASSPIGQAAGSSR